jgi:hypothetical protein
LTQAPKPLMGDGQTEFNIYPNLPHTPYLEVQTVGFGASTLAYRTAETLTVNWSGPQQFYSPPEINQPNIMIYSAKMHPMLTNSGADFVASYSTNSTNFNTLVQDASLYYPRFVKANWP